MKASDAKSLEASDSPKLLFQESAADGRGLLRRSSDYQPLKVLTTSRASQSLSLSLKYAVFLH